MYSEDASSILARGSKTKRKDMKIDGLVSGSIYDLIEKINYIKLQKEDIISVFQDNKGQYIVIYLEK